MPSRRSLRRGCYRPREREARLAEVREGIAKVVAELDKRVAQPNPTPSVRDLPNAALAKLILGQDPRGAEQLVRLAFDQQDMDPRSDNFGMVPWQIGHPEINDANAIEFATQALGPMLIHYGDKLSPEFKSYLLPHVKAAFAAMDRRNFKTPAYTNIFLMRAVNMVLLGEAVGDAKAADTGYKQLDEWIAFTQQAGVHEFDSPTYYFVDLDSLGAGYLYAKRPGARQMFKAILDYFWTDIAANYFVPDGLLTGPASRNYDFLHSSGGIDYYLYAEGFRGTKNFGKPDLEKTFLLEGSADAGYHPGEAIFALARLPERVVVSRWDTDPHRTRYHYLTADFSIGSASGGDYTAHDKLITVELASDKKNLPVMTVVPDRFDAPYGKEKTLDGSGHSKPTHLKLHPTVTQEKGAMLALLDLDPADESKRATKEGGLSSLATNLLLPAAADAVVLDGKPLTFAARMTVAAKENTVLAVREGKSAVAVRIFHADGCAGQPAAFEVKADEAGLKDGAARLAVYHYRGPVKMLTDKHARVGLLIVAGPCKDDADFAALQAKVRSAAIEQGGDEGRWQVNAHVQDGPVLEADCDLKKHATAARKVNGRDVPASALSVNGEDTAGAVWRELPK